LSSPGTGSCSRSPRRPGPAGLTLPSSLVGQSVQLTLNLAGAAPTATQAENDDDQGDNNDNGDNGDNDDDSGGNGDD
jgi:hypothetical protein